MLHYTPEQLASLIALPITTILLFWTTAIFHKNRKSWGPHDIPIITLLILSILRNLTILTYLILHILRYDVDYCSAISWTLNSVHAFQASTLTSIAVIGLLAVRLANRRRALRSYLTPTHVIYHLCCLTTLCACVGVAAILAHRDGVSVEVGSCSFLPFELDGKFRVFVIVLHGFLAVVSFVCFVGICYCCCMKKDGGFDYLKKSSSDLSELSNNFHGINGNVSDNRCFYDTYTIQKEKNNNCCGKDVWGVSNSDVLSMTVSSTNSRRPCIVKKPGEGEDEEEMCRTGLETIHPVLIVCYLFYHLPILVLCLFPSLISPWPVAGIALWLGLVQDVLIPVGLGIVDSRFCQWVSEVYRCSDAKTGEKLPQVGLDGKFRPFCSTNQTASIPQENLRKNLQTVEFSHRFPITNGSLYTSIDGRLPVIHNYRRHKENRTGIKTTHHDLQSSNVALHSSHLSRQDSNKQHIHCANCDLCPSHSDRPTYLNRQLNFPPNDHRTRLTQSQESIISNTHQKEFFYVHNSTPDARRISRSEETLRELRNEKKKQFVKETNEFSSSDDDEDEGDFTDAPDESLSSNNSITTVANYDFEFYQNRNDYYSNNKENHRRINRSNSKRSLEDFQAFVSHNDEENSMPLQRSNSYMTLEDRKKKKTKCERIIYAHARQEGMRHKMKSVECLPDNRSVVFIEDLRKNNGNCGYGSTRGTSVPDFKKIFISEYI